MTNQNQTTWIETCKNFTLGKELLQDYDNAMERKTERFKIWVDQNILPSIAQSIQDGKGFKLSTDLGLRISYMEYEIKINKDGIGTVKQYNTGYKEPLLSTRELKGWYDVFSCLAHGVSSNKKRQTEITIN